MIYRINNDYGALSRKVEILGLKRRCASFCEQHFYVLRDILKIERGKIDKGVVFPNIPDD